MSISTWSIKNPIPTFMLFVILTLGGWYTFSKMKVQNFPDLDLPVITVAVTLPGAAPNQLETEVARKLENSIATLAGLKHQYTKIQDGSVSIRAEFEIEKPVQEALDEFRSAVDRVRSELPASVEEPVVSKVDLASSPVLAFAVQSDRMDLLDLSWFVDNDIEKLLLSVPGVGAVRRVGGVERELRIELSHSRLQALQTTVADISRQLANIQVERAGGKVKLGDTDQPLRTLGAVHTVADLKALPIALSDGRRIRLGDVATLRDTYKDPDQAAFFNGEPVVGFEVLRSRGASEIEVGDAVLAKLEQLIKEQRGLEISETFDFVTRVRQEFEASARLLYEGALLAILVVWLFLRDLRATLVSALALPLSIIPAFIGMYYMGFSINIVTMLALSLCVGILVDDAIVEVENIVRHMRMGKTPYQAAIEATEEIGLAVVATTAVLIAVFLPTAFMTGIVGKFFKQFGWSATFAIFASLVVARMFSPMMAAYVLKPLVGTGQALDRPQRFSVLGKIWRWAREHPQDPAWLRSYTRIAGWSMRNRWFICVLTMGFFIGSLALVPLLPKGFIPPNENEQTQVNLELPPGSSLQQTIDVAQAVRKSVSQVPHIRSVYTTIGSGAAGANALRARVPEVRKATLTIKLDERNKRPPKKMLEQQLRDLLSTFPGVRFKVGLNDSGEKYQFALSSANARALAQAVRMVEKDLRTIPRIGNIESTAALVRNELHILPDYAKAAERGVTSAAIADTLRVTTQGDFDSRVAKLNLSERQIPVVVRLSDVDLHDIDALKRLALPSGKGLVPLEQVAKMEYGSGPAVVDRLDRERNVSFNIELAGVPLGDFEEQLKQLPSIKNLPDGVQQVVVGDAEAQRDMVAGFSLAMSTAVILMYVVLVLLFKSFWHPFTLLMALPLAFGGAFAGLLVTGKMLSMPAFIGMLMLMGVAAKNSILLVEYALKAQESHGLSAYEAMLDACHKRARPVVMTSIAMGAGMLPVALGIGVTDPSFRAPMAIAVIGGLVTSTLLSLLVVPPVYTLMEGARRRLFGRKRSALPPQIQPQH